MSSDMHRSDTRKGQNMRRALLMTLLATIIVSIWLAIAGFLGWLKAGTSTATAAILLSQTAPAIAAWLMHYDRRDKRLEMGFRKAPLRWYVSALALGAVLPMTAAALRIVFGLGKLSSHWNSSTTNIISLLIVLLVAPWLLSIPALGEEIGWRGYLLPRLAFLGRRGALVCSGLLWSFWHLTFVIAGQSYPGQPIAGILLTILFITGVGVIVGYLRLQSHSIFVTALMHGTLNAYTLAASMLVSTYAEIYEGFTGLVGIAVIWSIAAWILWRGSAKT